MAYCFEFLSEDIDFENIESVVESFFKNHPKSWPCWAFSNHDSKRIVSRAIKPKNNYGKTAWTKRKYLYLSR